VFPPPTSLVQVAPGDDRHPIIVTGLEHPGVVAVESRRRGGHERDRGVKFS
jgi:hypothetical protein